MVTDSQAIDIALGYLWVLDHFNDAANSDVVVAIFNTDSYTWIASHIAIFDTPGFGVHNNGVSFQEIPHCSELGRAVAIDGEQDQPRQLRDEQNIGERRREPPPAHGGPIGSELGQAFQRLGTQVTLVQRRGYLLPKEEPEARELIAARLGADIPYLWLGPAVWIVAAHDSIGGVGRSTLPDGTAARAMVSGVVSTAELWRES